MDLISQLNNASPLSLCLGLFLVAATLYMIASAVKRRAQSSQSFSMGVALVAEPQKIISFSGPENALAIHQFAQASLFQYLLTAMEVALKREGYELTRAMERRVTMGHHAWKRVARHVYIQRDRYLAPLQGEDTINMKADLCDNDGFSDSLLGILIQGSVSQGWVIAERAGRERQACQLRQVQITVRVMAPVITRDVVRCLSELSDAVRNKPFPETFIGNHISKVLDENFNYEFASGLCETSPGWFPDAAGSRVPDNMTTGQFPATESSRYRHYIVRVQGTRHSSPDTLADYIDEAARRISAGEHGGALYDDDSGYAFLVTKPVPTH
jgi:hypothetical protein